MFIEPPNIISSGASALFTTKVSASKILSKKFNISKNDIYLPIQKHTGNVHLLESDFKPVTADAVITSRKNVLIGVMVADCVPILLYDRNKKVIGAVHAGWKGTSTQILKKTIKTMHKKFHCSSKDILIAIGPSIRQCCYSVGNEVITAVQKSTGEGDYYQKQDGQYFIDLSSANKVQALSLGVPGQNIWQSEECTFCNPDKFHSYRYSRDHAGRQGGFIGMW